MVIHDVEGENVVSNLRGCFPVLYVAISQYRYIISSYSKQTR